MGRAEADHQTSHQKPERETQGILRTMDFPGAAAALAFAGVSLGVSAL